jgi:DNA-binding SARP family transcriptional activator/pimeloyl-ACP methyl ester carboxylesterase
VDFRILGPFEATDGARPLSLSGGKQTALLVLLLLDAGRVVPVDRIVDDLWGEDVPETAQKMVQIHVSQLRKALPEPRLRTRAPGYVLEVGADELDLARFERLVADGRRALSDGDAEQAAELLRKGLALWRGPALAELSEPFARHESARLEEVRVDALESRLEADLAVGRHGDVVGELEALVARHPLRERLRSLQMVALYRSGRHAEALAGYQEFRRTLAEELGIEPSPSLRELERRILRHDPGLEPESESRTPVPPGGARPARLRRPVAETRYAKSGDVSIAYQVVGEGPLDIVLVHGWVCTFEPGWEHPRIAHLYRRLAEMGRLVLFDKRGTGLSDRVSPDNLPDLQTRMDDVRAVLDAVGSERAVLLGISEGGPMCALFAATYPARTHALVLMGTFARLMRAPDYPIGFEGDREQRRPQRFSVGRADWGRAVTREWLGRTAAGVLEDEDELDWYVSYVVRGASPAAVRALELMNVQIDVREVLPSIHVPTLVLYRAGEAQRHATRYMGERIPGATIVELPGDEHLPWEGDADALVDEIGRFLAGTRDEVALDRILATLLFTDVVGSTAKAAELGDRAWGDLLERHHHAVRAQLARFRGREVDTTGDGVFATFDGPARAVRCAAAIVEAVRALGLEVRAGLHTGEIEQSNGSARGIAVHVAARIAAAAQPGEVLVSSTVKDIVAGSGIGFEERGEHRLTGVPGAWRLFAATS